MPLQVLKIHRMPTLTTISSMDDVVHGLTKEVEENGYVVVRTEIDYDMSTKQCRVDLQAEKRGRP